MSNHARLFGTKELKTRDGVGARLAVVGAAITLAVTGFTGPVTAAEPAAVEQGVLQPGDTMGPDVAAGNAQPLLPVKLQDDVDAARLAASCEPTAIAAAAAKSAPITADLAEQLSDRGLVGARGAVCVRVSDSADTRGRAERDAVLAQQRKGAPGTVDALRQAATQVEPDGPSTQEFIPIPDWCVEHAFDGWWGYRTSQCQIRDMTLFYFVINHGVPRHVGTAKALEFDYAYTSDLIDRFAFQIRITKYWGERAGNIEIFTRVVGGAFCEGDCKPDGGGSISPSRFARNVNNDGESYWLSTRSEPGGIGYSSASWQWHVESPFFMPSEPPFTPIAPQIRCDNAFSTDGNDSGDPVLNIQQPTIGAGCVFPAIMPVMTYSKTGFYPTLAMHIEAAQNSGLPGRHPDGVPLTRLQDPVKKRLNGDTACPPSTVWTRPDGKSCDEYPFRSTYQGAATAIPPGTARTFAPPNTIWCEMDPAWGVPTGVTGPTGWSSCMIPVTDNSPGGAALGSFYRSNRVLDGDQFRVQITP